MVSFRRRLYRVMDSAEVIVEVLDARFIRETRNEEIERYAQEHGKKLVTAVNKKDLVPPALLRKAIAAAGLKAVVISSKKKEGISMLRGIIKKRAGREGKVAFVGYPNTGKSSLINALTGRRSALTSPKAGFTRGEQMVRLSDKVMLIDSPGVISYDEMDEEKLALISAKSPGSLSDIEGSAEYIVSFIMENRPEALSERYGVRTTEGEGAGEVIKKTAVSKGLLLKGGRPDMERASRLIIEDWQKGRLYVFAKA
jgi:ribosome biogenesis GTPase A